MTYFILGLICGIMVPAPYDKIVTDNVKKLWNSIFNRDPR